MVSIVSYFASPRRFACCPETEQFLSIFENESIKIKGKYRAPVNDGISCVDEVNLKTKLFY